MKFDELYIVIAEDVLAELSRYKGYSYDRGFQSPTDISRLAVAIQRAVEHKQAGECLHEEPCKMDATRTDSREGEIV